MIHFFIDPLIGFIHFLGVSSLWNYPLLGFIHFLGWSTFWIYPVFEIIHFFILSTFWVSPHFGFYPLISRVILVVLFNAVFPLVTSHIVNVTVGSFVVLLPLVRDVISMDSPVFTWTFLTKVFSIGFMIGSKLANRKIFQANDSRKRLLITWKSTHKSMYYISIDRPRNISFTHLP